jgi:hypothetical protein
MKPEAADTGPKPERLEDPYANRHHDNDVENRLNAGGHGNIPVDEVKRHADNDQYDNKVQKRHKGLPFFVRMFVAPLPVLLLLTGRGLAEDVYLNVIFIQKDAIAALFVFIPPMVVLVFFVVIAMVIVVVGKGQRCCCQTNGQKEGCEVSMLCFHLDYKQGNSRAGSINLNLGRQLL